MNWAVAHRIAGIAAIQAHRDLAIDRTRYVPVHQALRTASLTGMARPMPRLFGVYFSPADNGPAVLLNASLNIITQRHTAAHELGHHRLRHRTAADDELNPALRWGDGTWPEEEKTAEAFAAWFLMPRPAVLAALEWICRGRPDSPVHVYRLARELGTSYAGTVRHLQHLRLLDATRAREWAKVSPADLRSSLAQGAVLPPDAHVHVLTARMREQHVHAEVGDLLVLDDAEGRFASLPKGLALWPGVSRPLAAVEVTEELDGVRVLEFSCAGSREVVEVSVHRESPRLGVDEVWPE
ncbi:ImmA/IrrE family metallo-endopeptidase [Streptomyces sp. NBC_01617]|uniref:ImmA/IrrE family metallo-endopeptidase n=1 Tax=Streptomyces sp. NBC_01617 TaxID=2975899 RepID=UPI00386E116B|nr:ImmA/IrrE family metallo-endopeptidase [Streptomyces sp. NBC_01617]WTE64816.1 ImmA/IrrE family metallo-endopeptidase [Streptomyces sp. NBC_01617]